MMREAAAAEPDRTPLLALDNISKVFGGVKALKAVKFDVMPGEVLCLAGENGCGKSTIIKIINGVYQPEPGAVMLMDGESIEGLDPARARELGIQVIWQDLALFPEMTVAENIAFEQNLGGRPRFVNYGKMKEAARRILARLGVGIDLNRSVRSLSIAQRQIVAIARALVRDARLVFMDEPTASLSHAETEALLAIVRRLSADGIAVVFVSHRLAEVLEVCTRVTVLRDGQYVGTFPTEGMTQTRLTELMTGRTFDYEVRKTDLSAAPVVLDVRGLSRGREYADISLRNPQGRNSRHDGTTGRGAHGACIVVVRHDAAARRIDAYRRQRDRAALESRCDPQRHRVCVRGSTFARTGPAAIDRRQHGRRGARPSSGRDASYFFAQAQRPDRGLDRATRGEDRQAGRCGLDAIGRQPATHRARQMAGDEPEAADPGFTDCRRRRGRARGHLRDHPQAGGARAWRSC